MKRVLMVAYHFPPLAGSSGIQRTLRFVQHLPAFGWQPLVLSASPWAYENTSKDLLGDVPHGTVVRRAFALDTARHLQIAGRYLAWMARPDRWVSWKFAAVREGLKLIRDFKPDAIWSTYPIATAHVIAAALHRKTHIPWVADFRDPMAQDGYPADPRTWTSYLKVESDAIAHAQSCVFTTPSAAEMYRQRYPARADRIVVLENGYDEESFANLTLPTALALRPAEGRRPLLMLHSGIVYPSERDPTQFFVALGRLRQAGLLASADLRVRFRAAVHDELLQNLAKAHGAEEFIELRPAIAYRDALAEMMEADVLLVMQASNCNAQIPAKIYEYLRAAKPMLGLTDPAGDTALVMRRAGLAAIARLDSADEIFQLLPTLLRACSAGTAQVPDQAAVREASRYGRTKVLANLLAAHSTLGAVARRLS